MATPTTLAVAAKPAASVARRLLRLARGGRLTFFVGAYISAAPPSELPMAAALKRGIAHALLMHSVPGMLPVTDAASLDLLLGGTGFDRVPLELIADEMLGKAGLSAADLLSFMRSVPPNHNHAVLAKLLDDGLADVITTNFDELIESCRHASDAGAGLWKVHGTLSDPASLAVRLPQIGRGMVSLALRRSLSRRLTGRDVVFVGYSGTDQDLVPILRSTSMASATWIIRPPGSGESLADLGREHRHLAHLFARDVDVTLVSTDGTTMLASLGQLVGLSPPTVGPAPPASVWESRLAASVGTVGGWRAAFGLARLLLVCGAPEPAAVTLARLAAAATTRPERAAASLHSAEALCRLTRYEQARTQAEEAARRYVRLGRQRDAMPAYQILSLIAERTGHPPGWALRYMRLIERHSRGRDDPLVVNNRLNLATWLKNRGRLAEADSVLRSALREARRSGDLRALALLHQSMGIVWRRRRQLALERGADRETTARFAAVARYHLARALTLAVFLGDVASQSRSLSTRIDMELDAQTPASLERARRLLDRAEQVAASSPEPHQVGYVMSLRAEWLEAVGRHQDCIACSSRALTMLSNVAHRSSCLVARARARLTVGDVAAARDDLEAALTGMPRGGADRLAAERLLAEADRRAAGPAPVARPER